MSNEEDDHNDIVDGVSLLGALKMTIFFAILVPIFGIIGVISGIILNEFMRRKSRKEVYAPAILKSDWPPMKALQIISTKAAQ